MSLDDTVSMMVERERNVIETELEIDLGLSTIINKLRSKHRVVVSYRLPDESQFDCLCLVSLL